MTRTRRTVMMHHDLTHARLQARSTDKPVAYAPAKPFTLFGHPANALWIRADGLCSRVRVYLNAPRKWVWLRCAPFDPARESEVLSA